MHSVEEEAVPHTTQVPQTRLYPEENLPYTNELDGDWLSHYEAEGATRQGPLKNGDDRFQSGPFPAAFQQGIHFDKFAPGSPPTPFIIATRSDNDIPHSDSNLGDKISMRCPKDQVTSKKIRNASKGRRKNPAKFKCPMEGCEGDFTRKHNLTSTFSLIDKSAGLTFTQTI